MQKNISTAAVRQSPHHCSLITVLVEGEKRFMNSDIFLPIHKLWCHFPWQTGIYGAKYVLILKTTEMLM